MRLGVFIRTINANDKVALIYMSKLINNTN